MNRALPFLLVLFSLASLTTLAAAGGREGTIGVGAEYQLSGVGGVSLNLDGGIYHAGAFLGFSDAGGTDDTDIMLGGRFFYHVHSTAMSDFGLGGSLGLELAGDRRPNVDDNQTNVLIEPGAQIRAFVANNVALSITAGFAFAAGDAEGTAFTGQTAGSAGVHYYFF